MIFFPCLCCFSPGFYRFFHRDCFNLLSFFQVFGECVGSSNRPLTDSMHPFQVSNGRSRRSEMPLLIVVSA